MKLDELSYDYRIEAADAHRNVLNNPAMDENNFYVMIEKEFSRITEGLEAAGADIVAVGSVHNRERLTYPPGARGKSTLQIVE